MALVLTYWSLPDEENDFLDYLFKWDIYAYPARTSDTIADISPIPIRELLAETNPLQLFFGPWQFLSENDISLRNQMDGVCLYEVTSVRSQAIGYKRPHFNGSGVLSMSRLSAYWKYPSPNLMEYVEKDAEFIKWAKRVLTWARRRACERIKVKGYFYSVTKRVKTMVEKEKLVLDF
jgi:hypothetical protein